MDNKETLLDIAETDYLTAKILMDNRPDDERILCNVEVRKYLDTCREAYEKELESIEQKQDKYEGDDDPDSDDFTGIEI